MSLQDQELHGLALLIKVCPNLRAVSIDSCLWMTMLK